MESKTEISAPTPLSALPRTASGNEAITTPSFPVGSERRHNLPVELTCFVNRDRDVAELPQSNRPDADRAHRSGFDALSQAPLGGILPRLLGQRTNHARHSPTLTPREWEVATLVAQGYSNRQIGQTLVITERTAANHIEHILRKLTFHRRAQIAAWVVIQPTS